MYYDVYHVTLYKIVYLRVIHMAVRRIFILYNTHIIISMYHKLLYFVTEFRIRYFAGNKHAHCT